VLNARGKCATIHRAYSTGIAWNMVHGAQAPCCCCALPTADFSQEVKRSGISGNALSHSPAPQPGAGTAEIMTRRLETAVGKTLYKLRKCWASGDYR
ncbi:MAG: hypothetical protein IZT59_06780, partial [Verrucomicrobia bacterium]|nr:hypothetical protein [Verrucomicrobiota bacterium]